MGRLGDNDASWRGSTISGALCRRWWLAGGRIALVRRSRSSRPPGRVWRGGIGVLVTFGILEAFTRAQIVDPAFLPPATSILAEVGRLLVSGSFLGKLLDTVGVWAVGLAITVAIGVPLGIVLGSSELCYRLARVVIEIMRPIPSVALIPLSILLFGTALKMQAFLILYACIWPVLFNTIYGVHDVDPIAKDTARIFGCSRLGVLWRVSLPSAGPLIATGVRIACAFALILAITAEIVSGGDIGLGGYISAAGTTGTLPSKVFAATAITGLLGLVLNLVIGTIQRMFVGWHAGMVAQTRS